MASAASRAAARWASVRETLVLTAWVGVVAEYVFDVTFCVGPSMMPTFAPHGDVVLTDHFMRRFGSMYGAGFRVGDVVVAKSPRDPSVRICKRIIGLPGDVVCVDPAVSSQRIEVPRGHVWLQGDNVANSTDSRVYGPVPMGLLIGRVFARVYPLSKMQWIRSGEHSLPA